ncbi:MAG: hypothetical protein GXP34_14635 [Actinobacteria bacterium]|nr:hypothetical protein [Actinomycetota bacterium]
MRRRRTAAGFLVGLVLGASCSGAPSQTTAATSTEREPAPIQVTFPLFETSWQPADDMGQVVASARSALVKAGGSVLVPASLPPGAGTSTGRMTITRTEPFHQVSVDVNVTFMRAQREEALSLSSYPTDPEHPTCAGRALGEGSWDAAEPVEVRSSPGCRFTNDVGLSFIEWEEGSHRYHVETFMTPGDAISWLASWKPLP